MRVENPFELREALDEPINRSQVGYLEEKAHLHHTVAVRVGRAREHVGARLREHAGDVEQKIGAIDALDVHLDLIRARRRRAPPTKTSMMRSGSFFSSMALGQSAR